MVTAQIIIRTPCACIYQELIDIFSILTINIQGDNFVVVGMTINNEISLSGSKGFFFDRIFD
jgi:hypothetical protein